MTPPFDHDRGSRRDLLAAALGAAGILALPGRASAAGLGKDDPDTCEPDPSWAEWTVVALDATAFGFMEAIGEGEFVDGTIDGPILSGLKFSMPEGVVAARVEGDLTDVGLPKDIASQWGRIAEAIWTRVWSGWTLPPSNAFPQFAAVAAPEAPVTRARRIPLQLDASKDFDMLSARGLYAEVEKGLGDLLNLPGLKDAVWTWANTLGGAIAVWNAEAEITDLWGKGPVPSFAPPYVPVGPVVAGDNIAAPGHIAARTGVKPSLTQTLQQVSRTSAG